ncbi:MAG: tetratricopeptide repeat protein [Phycisphaerae bacterium]|nr:tetratricopeptide repeat protein [Phycisphaerae bacterium]
MFGQRLSKLVPAMLFVCLAVGNTSVWAGPYAPRAGRPHPQIVLPTIEGDRVVALSGLRGQKLLLVHFASWDADSRSQVPVWHAKTKGLVESKDLVVLGVAQEQHADRCRLYAQWECIDWPILHDPLNLVGIESVPSFVAIDEHGIVRDVNPTLDTFVKSFVSKKFPAPGKPPQIGSDKLLEPKVTRRYAGEARTAEGWRNHGDMLVLAGLQAVPTLQAQQINEAIEAYQRALEIDAKDADSFFRLGVAFRVRYDRTERHPDDFQAAVDAWQEAFRLRPKSDVFRRRVQQYGPCVDKPYSFYGWVEAAREQIVAHGETPIELACEPVAAERASPAEKFKSSNKKSPESEASGSVKKDTQGLIEMTQAVVRGTSKKNQNIARVHLTFRPNAELHAQWVNEAEPLRVWLKRPKTGKLTERFVEYRSAPQAKLTEERSLSFEVKLPSKQKGTLTIKGYALYSVGEGKAEGKEGECQLLRRDIKVKIKL